MSGGRSTWDLSEFHGGIDLRDGLFTGNQTRFRELTNLRIDKGRKLVRRPPCLRVSGDLDANSQGLISIDGQLYTFARKGDAISHTGDVAAMVQTLAFDVPDLTTSWELLSVGVFDGYAAAWIKHTFPSTQYPALVFLHVWDGLVYAPTFVQDPDLPGSFSPSIADLADQEFDPDFVPVLAVGVTKLWTSTLRGNAQACRTADARVWNQRTKDSLLSDGERWCFVVPEGVGIIRNFIVPRNADWMTGDGRWTYYVLEYNDGTSWVPMAEVSSTPSVAFTWRPVSVASRFAGGWNEIQVQVCWGRASAGLIRLRLVSGATSVDVTASPSVSTIGGSGGAWKLSVAEAQFRYRSGDAQTVAAHNTADMADGRTYLLAVTADPIGFPELVDITGGFDLNGWDREHRRIIKKIITPLTSSGFTALNTPWKTYLAGPGTVTVNVGTNSVVGVGTNFTSSLKIGSTIRVAGVERVVASITDALNLTITTTWPGTSAGVGWDVVYGYATYTGGKTHVYVDATLAALLSAGNTLRINAIDYQVAAVAGQDVTITQNGVDGDYTGNVNQYWNPIYLTNQPTITDYKYAYVANADSDWYTDRLVEYVEQAGAEDALAINTAAQDNTGGKITSIATVRQRMVISYPGSIQLWSIDQDTNRTAYLDQLSFGTGSQAYPSPTTWYSSVILPMVTGFRAIDAVGSNLNNLQDLNIGEPIADLDMIDIRSASFWPWFGQFIVVGKRGDDLVFLCLDYSRESKITAWSQWNVASLADVDHGTLIADQGKLRFRSGTGLFHFDAQADGNAIPFRDFGDTVGNAYESSALFHFNDLGKPGTNKRWTGLDIVQDGSSSLAFQLTPYGAWGNGLAGPVFQGPTIEGITYGRSRIPVAMMATAISPKITTRSEVGWRLQRLALDFLLLRR